MMSERHVFLSSNGKVSRTQISERIFEIDTNTEGSSVGRSVRRNLLSWSEDKAQSNFVEQKETNKTAFVYFGTGGAISWLSAKL